jgi:hypothetical protein
MVQDGIVLLGKIEILDTCLEIVGGGEIRTVVALLPFGRVMMFAHAAEPKERISNGDRGQNIIGIDAGIVERFVGLTKFFIARRCMFAPTI